jgi:hypothetical protein
LLHNRPVLPKAEWEAEVETRATHKAPIDAEDVDAISIVGGHQSVN